MQGHTVNYKTTKGKETRLISNLENNVLRFSFCKTFFDKIFGGYRNKEQQQRDLDATSAKYVDGLDKRHWRQKINQLLCYWDVN